MDQLGKIKLARQAFGGTPLTDDEISSIPGQASPLDNSLDNYYTKDVLLQGVPGFGMGQSVTGSDLIPSPLLPSPMDTPKPQDASLPIKEVLNKIKAKSSPAVDTTQSEPPAPISNIPQKEKDTSLDELRAAQAGRSSEMNNLAILEGLLNAGRGLGGQKTDPNVVKNFQDIANNKVADVVARQEYAAKDIDFKKASMQLDNAKAENDPNSDVSKALRESIKMRYASIGHPIKVGENLSAAQLKVMYPSGDLADDFLKMDAMKESRATREHIQKESKNEKLAKELAETLDISKTTSRSPLGIQKNILDDADRALGLYSQFEGGNMPAAQSEEFALATARLISGGRGGMSRAQIEALVPHTARGSIQKTIAWLTNNPVGQNQQKFINLMHETALREREIAKAKMDELLQAKLPRFEALKKEDPSLYNNIVQGSPLGTEKNVKVHQADEMVRVMSPEGKTGSIPKSKLEAAKAKGFKEI